MATNCGRWALFLLGWAGLSLLFAPEAYLSFYLRRTPISWSETIELTVLNSGIALLFVPGIVWLARRVPLERNHWRRVLLVHVPACLVFSMGHSVLYAIACHAWNDVGSTLFYRFHPNLVTYWAVVGLTQAYDYLHKFQARERQLARLQLNALKAQLQPHFLFNALHTVAAMMHQDVPRADRMIGRLSELLRLTIAGIDRHEVPLTEELRVLDLYLDIERERFGKRLEVSMNVDPEALDALVPAFVLQPLVENCVRHGFGGYQDDALIEIRAARADNLLTLQILDNGRGLPGSRPLREGVGLTNTRQRLQQLYGPEQTFDIGARPSIGVAVTVKIPFHTSEAARSAGEAASDEHPHDHSGRRALGTRKNSLAPQA
jgi:hypothetical protein